MAIGSAIVGVVGAVAGSRSAKSAAKTAARAQTQAADLSVAEQRRQFDETQRLLGPSIEAGDTARQQQLALLGLLGEEAQQTAQTQFAESPGQQFIRERQQRALVRNQAAIGGLGGGNIRTALQEQAAGFAAQDFGNQFNRLAGLSGAGQTAATNIGQFGQTTAGNISNALTNRGEAIASGAFGKGQAQANLISNLTSAGTTLAQNPTVQGFFSDSRMKKSIRKIGRIGRLNVYEWIWKATGLEDVGFIAEEVKQEFPDLVQEHNGFLMVNYDQAIAEAA